MTAQPNGKIEIFLDSSVLVAACISTSGGSFRFCREGNEGKLSLFINRYVNDEVVDVLNRKYPDRLKQLPSLLKWSKIKVLPNAKAGLVEQLFEVIDHEDAPVLASAIANKIPFLTTLDRKHFLTEKLAQAGLPLVIATPQDFFQKHWL